MAFDLYIRPLCLQERQIRYAIEELNIDIVSQYAKIKMMKGYRRFEISKPVSCYGFSKYIRKGIDKENEERNDA